MSDPYGHVQVGSVKGGDLQRSIDDSFNARADGRPTEPTIGSAKAADVVSASEAEVEARSYVSKTWNLGQQFPSVVHPQNKLLETPRKSYSVSGQVNAGVPEQNGTRGGIRANLSYYQPVGTDPLVGKPKQFEGGENHRAQSDIGPTDDESFSKVMDNITRLT